MKREHDFDAAWKTILEAFETELIELLFPELYKDIDWERGSESLDNELAEIQKEVFDKKAGQKIISDKIIKVRMKNDESKILFIHAEVQSYSKGNDVFGERMFRYFYRIWDRFRYRSEKNPKSEIVAAAIYTYHGNTGKDKRYVYRHKLIEEDILIYNFRTIDIDEFPIENINESNPLKLVFKVAKKLLKTRNNDKDILKAKIELAEELRNYTVVKNEEQLKALVDFLEYLFLINDPEIERIFEDYREKRGGIIKMTVEDIREKYYMIKGREEGKVEGKAEGKAEGKEEGLAEGKIKIAKNLLDVLDDKTISEKTGLEIEMIEKLRKEQ